MAQDGIGLAVLYPDCQLAFQFHSGYVPAEFSGEITACDGREVLTIDHQPAAEVYARWCGREQPWPVAPGDMLCQFVEQNQMSLDKIPFITPFTFSEQVRLPNCELAYGNLMVSSVIFLTR